MFLGSFWDIDILSGLLAAISTLCLNPCILKNNQNWRFCDAPIPRNMSSFLANRHSLERSDKALSNEVWTIPIALFWSSYWPPRNCHLCPSWLVYRKNWPKLNIFLLESSRSTQFHQIYEKYLCSRFSKMQVPRVTLTVKFEFRTKS